MMGRELIQVVQIDQPICSLTYGVAPCQAELGDTGERKCFNTAKTCQDVANYNPETLTLRFGQPNDILPPGVIPSVRSVSTSPTQVNVVGGDRSRSPLGVRAELRVTFQDHAHSDLLVDPYRLERDYDPNERGTFWTKWLARNPYYNNNLIRVLEGERGTPIEEFESRTYLIDAIDGTDNNGTVTLRAKDVLKLADNDRAQAPEASPGELIVDYEEEESISQLRVTRAAASDYPSPGTVRVNDELMRYTGVSTISSTEIRLTGITRATDGSERQSHDAGDRVQRCIRYNNVRVDELAHEWLTQFADVPSEFIPLADWDEEADIWLEQFRVSGLITEPTGVTDLLGEITEQCMFYIWWDERDQEIKLKALRPAYLDAVTPLDGMSNVLADSVSIRPKPRERVSQVWIFWGQRNPTQRLNEETNFRRIRIRADLDAESDAQYGEQRIKKIYSRWLTTDAQAIQTAVRLLARFRDTPEILRLELDYKDRSLWTADLADVTIRNIVDDTGAPKEQRWQVLSVEETEPGSVLEYELQKFEYGLNARFAYIMPNNADTYQNTGEEGRIIAAFIADENEEMPDGTPGYLTQ